MLKVICKKYVSSSDKLHSAVYSFMVAGISHIRSLSIVTLGHFTHQRTLRPVACNILELSGRKLLEVTINDNTDSI